MQFLSLTLYLETKHLRHPHTQTFDYTGIKQKSFIPLLRIFTTEVRQETQFIKMHIGLENTERYCLQNIFIQLSFVLNCIRAHSHLGALAAENLTVKFPGNR